MVRQAWLMLTGHMNEEPTLLSQTSFWGKPRSYRSFQLPGIDMLCGWWEFTTAKQGTVRRAPVWTSGHAQRTLWRHRLGL